MKAASPRIGPCIAQRGGTIRSTAFGSLTGVFFGTFPSGDPIIFLFIKSWARCSRVEKRFDLYDVVSTHSSFRKEEFSSTKWLQCIRRSR